MTQVFLSKPLNSFSHRLENGLKLAGLAKCQQVWLVLYGFLKIRLRRLIIRVCRYKNGMKRSRPFHVVAALITLFSVLFMQFAVASYACPTWKFGQAEQAAAMPMAVSMEMSDMSGCGGIDRENPNLCHAESHQLSQSLDKPELPHVQSFVPIRLIAAVMPANLIGPADPSRSTPDIQARTTAPPVAIRNCCFRF